MIVDSVTKSSVSKISARNVKIQPMSKFPYDRLVVIINLMFAVITVSAKRTTSVRGVLFRPNRRA